MNRALSRCLKGLRFEYCLIINLLFWNSCKSSKWVIFLRWQTWHGNFWRAWTGRARTRRARSVAEKQAILVLLALRNSFTFLVIGLILTLDTGCLSFQNTPVRLIVGDELL